MQRRQPVHVCGVDVRASVFDEPQHLVLVSGGARGEKDAPVCELDPPRLPLRLRRLPRRVRLAPSLQLLGALEQRRRRAPVRVRHLQDRDDGVNRRGASWLHEEKTAALEIADKVVKATIYSLRRDIESH